MIGDFTNLVLHLYYTNRYVDIITSEVDLNYAGDLVDLCIGVLIEVGFYLLIANYGDFYGVNILELTLVDSGVLVLQGELVNRYWVNISVWVVSCYIVEEGRVKVVLNDIFLLVVISDGVIIIYIRYIYIVFIVKKKYIKILRGLFKVGIYLKVLLV